MTNTARRPRIEHNLAVWLAVLTGPIAWSLHLLLSYAAISLECAFIFPQPLPGLSLGGLAVLVVTLLAVAASVYAGLFCARRWRQAGGLHFDSVMRVESVPLFMTVAGMTLNTIFLFAIVLATVPILVLRPCV